MSPYLLDKNPDDRPRRPWAHWAAMQRRTLLEALGKEAFDMIDNLERLEDLKRLDEKPLEPFLPCPRCGGLTWYGVCRDCGWLAGK